MVTIEKTGLLTHIDAAGNKTIMYPVTIPDAVDGLKEALNAFGIATGAVQEVPNDNLNTLTGNSIYKGLSGRTTGFPEGLGEWAFVLTLHYDDDCQYGKQIAWDMNGNTTTQRYKRAGAWNLWDCEGPPMVPGVEYRTTERWNGKPVYAKVIDCGVLPDRADICVLPQVDIVRWSGITERHKLIPSVGKSIYADNYREMDFYWNSDGTHLIYYCGTGEAGQNVTITVFYTYP